MNTAVRNGPRWKNVGLSLERDPKRTTRLILWILAGLLASTPLVVYMVQKGRYVETQLEIRKAQDQLQRLEETEHRYTIRRGKLESLDRAEAAAPVIGLKNPGQEQVVWVDVRPVSQGDRVARAEDR